MDTSNLYWGGTTAGPVQKLWTLGQVSRAQPTGSPFVITPTITSASPAIAIGNGVTNLYIGTTGNIIQFNATSQVLAATNTNPGSASVRGRIVATVLNQVFAGDDGGTMWAILGSNFAGTNKMWSYAVAGDSIRSSPFYDGTSNTLHFGTEAGKIVVLNSSGVALTGYPYVPGTTSDPIRGGILYVNGILVVGSTTGKLFFLDRNNGTTGPALIREYYFGPTESVSGIGYDSSGSRYMISVSDPSANDGRLYYIDVIADPTAGSS
jgi:outer membrane protein assembly factor BamB